MMLTQNVKRRNVAYARYQRALVVLLVWPWAVWNEVNTPSGTHVVYVAAVTAMGLLAGWMYREAVRWWNETET